MQKKIYAWFLLCCLFFTFNLLNIGSVEKSEVTINPKTTDTSQPANVSIHIFNHNMYNYSTDSNTDDQIIHESEQTSSIFYFGMNITQDGQSISQNIVINISIVNNNTPYITKSPVNFTYSYNNSIQLYVGQFLLSPIQEYDGQNRINFTVISSSNQFADTIVNVVIGIHPAEIYLPIIPILILNLTGGLVIIVIIVKLVKSKSILRKQLKFQMTQDDNRKILEEHEQVMKQLEQADVKPKEPIKKTEDKS